MKKFRYKAWDNKFNIINGVIEEESLQAAEEKLRNTELSIIKINPESDIASHIPFLNSRKLLTNQELSAFCGQVATIIQAGVNMVKGLSILEEQIKKKRLKLVISEILTGVKRGKPLSSSMQDTGVFPRLLTDMVASGELSGNIDSVLFNMENYFEREAAIKNQVMSAAIYPVVLVFMCFGMLLFFNFFIYPDLKDLFSNMQLPLISKIVLGILTFINSNFITIIVVIFVIIILLKYLSTIPSVNNRLSYVLLRIPVLGQVRIDFITTRFIRSMAIFMKSSVPILSIFDSIQSIVGNYYVSEKVRMMKTDITNGKSLADAIDRQQIFEPLMVQMIRVGEETGKLDDILFKLSDIYDKKLDTNIKRLMALAEPVFILVIGIAVAAIIVSIALPIMQMSTSVGKSI